MSVPIPGWGEITAILAALGGAIAWLDRRRGRMADLAKENEKLTTERDALKVQLSTAVTEADKTDRSHREAMDAMNAEIAEWRRRDEAREAEWQRQRERLEDRITFLEDRLYAGGGRS